MGIQWSQKYEIGILEIDNQHKELFSKVDDLFEACNQGKGKQEVGSLIKFLGDYVVHHFKTEESYQQKIGYPDYLVHKKLHDQFIKDFSVLQEQFDKNGASALLVIQVNKQVVDWLVTHISKQDKLLAAFEKSK